MFFKCTWTEVHFQFTWMSLLLLSVCLSVCVYTQVVHIYKFMCWWVDNFMLGTRTLGPGPIKKISLVKIRCTSFEHSGWLKTFEQPIRVLKSKHWNNLFMIRPWSSGYGGDSWPRGCEIESWRWILEGQWAFLERSGNIFSSKLDTIFGISWG